MGAGGAGERERALVADGDDEVVGGDPSLGEAGEDFLDRRERMRLVARREVEDVHLEALVGKAAAQRLDEVGGRAGLDRERTGAGTADGRRDVVRDVVDDAGAHAKIHRGAAQGDPLALGGHLDDDGLGFGFGFGLGRCRGEVLLRLRSQRLISRVGGLFAHSRPFSQSSCPLSRATCSKLLFLMSIRMSALAS